MRRKKTRKQNLDVPGCAQSKGKLRNLLSVPAAQTSPVSLGFSVQNQLMSEE